LSAGTTPVSCWRRCCRGTAGTHRARPPRGPKCERTRGRGGAVDRVDHQDAIGYGEVPEPAGIFDDEGGCPRSDASVDDQPIRSCTISGEDRILQQPSPFARVVARDAEAVGGDRPAVGEIDGARIADSHQLT
jgi:hypothetical protein